MDHYDAAQLARTLMDRHQLHEWTFAYNRRKRGMGLCVYEPRRIELSIYFVHRNDEPAVRDTILHEIAHALVGPRVGHGPGWKRMAKKLGARPERCGEADMPRGRWQATCPGCKKLHHRHRRPMKGRTYHCRSCGPRHGVLRFGLR